MTTKDTMATLAGTSAEAVGHAIGRYRLLETIGEGGFGVVWAAEQREPVRRRVALKIIKLGMDTKQVIARFEAERQALALMDHPNIAKVLDAGATEAGRPYFVMELVKGVPLLEFCDTARLDMRARLELFIHVCQAIQHAHQKGIIHRDIKPSNVLVTLHDGKPVPKVIDFGIAKATNQELTEKTIYTQHRQMIGTPAYMSPEQAEMSGLDIDTRSDIYALGVLLYELLTGTTPFDNAALMEAGFAEMMRIIREQEPHRPSTRLSSLGETATQTAELRGADVHKLNSLLRGDLDWIVMKCLEKDRVRRYATANGLAADVRRHLDDEPVSAGPPGTAYRLRKFVRRHRGQVVGATAVMVALVLGVVGTTVGMVRATRAEREQATLRAAADGARAAEALQRRAAEAARVEERELRERAQVETYAADMKAAQAALQQNNRLQAGMLLARHRPEPGERDLRGVEWYYLWQAAQGDERQSWDQGARAMGARFSPEGERIAVAAADGLLRIWDVVTGSLVAHFERRDPADHARITFDFAPDGTMLATATPDGIALLDCASWKVAQTLTPEGMDAPGARIVALEYAPDGRWLAASVEGIGIQVWDTASWEASMLESLPGQARLSFSADGTRLAATTAGAVDLWDLRTRQRREVPRMAPQARYEDSRFLHDSGRLVTVSDYGVVSVLEPSGEVVWSEDAHAGLVYALAVSHDGKHFATGGHDQLIHVWETASLTRKATYRGHHNEVWSLEFSADDRTLVSSSKDGTAKLWDLANAGRTDDWTLDAGEKPLGVDDDGAVIITRAPNGDAINFRRGSRIIKSTPSSTPLAEYRTVLAPASDNLYVVDPDGTARVFDVNTMDLRRTVQLDGACGRLYAVSPDEQWLAGTSGDELRLWELASGRAELHLPDENDSASFDLGAFSPDGRYFAYAVGCGVSIWDLSTQTLARELEPHAWIVYGISFSPDGTLVATSSWEGDVRIRAVETGEDVIAPLLGHASGVHNHSFSPDGTTLVTGGDDRTVRFWNVATGREMLVLPQARTRMLRVPAASAGGRLLMCIDEAQERRVRVTRLPARADI